MNRLKELRLEKGLLQSDISKLIEKSERTVGFYETGERDMGTKTLAILSNFFDVTIDYLLGHSDIRNPKEIIYNTSDFNFRKEAEGLSNEEISDALKIYKEMKKRVSTSRNKIVRKMKHVLIHASFASIIYLSSMSYF